MRTLVALLILAASAHAQEPTPAELLQRAMEQRAERERREAARVALLADPQALRPVLSAALCVAAKQARAEERALREGRAAAAANIDQADYEALDRLRGGVLRLNGAVAEYRDRLRQLKLKPMSCGAPMVRPIAACLDHSGDCSSVDAASIAVVQDVGEDTARVVF